LTFGKIFVIIVKKPFFGSGFTRLLEPYAGAPVGKRDFRENKGAYKTARSRRKIPYGGIPAGKRPLSPVGGPMTYLYYTTSLAACQPPFEKK
jgi:hypothetical protein